MPAKKRLQKSSTVSKKAKTNLGRLVREIVTNYEEKKFFVNATVAAGSGAAAAWTIVPLLEGNNAPNNIAQGTAANQRVGNRIKLQGIDMMIQVRPDTSSMNVTGSACRFVIIHDKQANSNVPAATVVFNEDKWYSNQNPIYEDRITLHNQLVHSMVFTGATSTAANTEGPMGLYRIHIPAKTVIEFNGSSGGFANVIKDNWFFAYCADATGCCLLTIETVVRYTDA